MKDFSAHYPFRKFEKVWIAPGKLVQAFDCGNENDYVWIPEEGYSTPRSSTFKSKGEARRKAIHDLTCEISRAQAELDKLTREEEEDVKG